MTQQHDLILTVGAVLIALIIVVGRIILVFSNHDDPQLNSALYIIVAFFFGGAVAHLSSTQTANQHREITREAVEAVVKNGTSNAG